VTTLWDNDSKLSLGRVDVVAGYRLCHHQREATVVCLGAWIDDDDTARSVIVYVSRWCLRVSVCQSADSARGMPHHRGLVCGGYNWPKIEQVPPAMAAPRPAS
jgi:hypothetical protein